MPQPVRPVFGGHDEINLWDGMFRAGEYGCAAGINQSPDFYNCLSFKWRNSLCAGRQHFYGRCDYVVAGRASLVRDTSETCSCWLSLLIQIMPVVLVFALQV